MLNKIQLLNYFENLKSVKIDLDFFSVSNMTISQVEQSFEKMCLTKKTDFKSIQPSDQTNMETDKNKKDILNEAKKSADKSLNDISVQKIIKVQAENDLNESKDGKKFEFSNSDNDNKTLNEANSALNVNEITNSLKRREIEITAETTESSICPRKDRKKKSKHQSPIIIKKRINYFEELISNYYLLLNVKFELDIRAGKQSQR